MIVLITGAAHGLGKAMALFFASKGDTVIACDIDQQALDDLSLKKNIHTFYMDVTDKESIIKVVLEVTKQFGHVDCLINNAGIYLGGPLTEINDEEFLNILKVNIYGPFLVTKHFFPLLKNNGRIINISSEVARISFPFNGPYSMTKHAMKAFSDALRRELLSFNIPVISIQLGAVKTDLLNATVKQFEKYRESAYTKGIKIALNTTINEQRHAADPLFVAKKIYKIAHKANPKIRYRIKNNKLRRMLEFLPDSVLDFFIRIML